MVKKKVRVKIDLVRQVENAAPSQRERGVVV